MQIFSLIEMRFPTSEVFKTVDGLFTTTCSTFCQTISELMGCSLQLNTK